MNGIINILKPPMMTSGSVVSAVKKITGQSHVGHTGTLDPNAAGVLPICIGKATKLAEYLLADEKEYVGEILFGAETDSCDTEGNVIRTDDKIPTIAEFENILHMFCGKITQVPPAFSAIKINGQKAYELARKNQNVEIPERKVVVHSLELLSQTAHNRFVIRVKCSKGTYIRSLARDIGNALGSCACLSMLVRTACGIFTIQNAVTIDEAKAAFENMRENEILIDPNTALADMPIVSFSKAFERRLLCGNSFKLNDAVDFSENITENDVIRVIVDGELIALARLITDKQNNKIIQPTKVIAE